MTDNQEKLSILEWAVKEKFNKPEVQEFLIKFVNEVLEETKIDWSEKITRQCDDESKADNLIEKMFAEMLTIYKIRR